MGNDTYFNGSRYFFEGIDDYMNIFRNNCRIEPVFLVLIIVRDAIGTLPSTI